MKIGIIGGSGLYQLDDETPGRFLEVDTPYGAPSGAYYCRQLPDREIYFLPRHGKGHRLLPSEINYRANIFGFKKLGVTHLISISAVGSLREEIEPGHFVLPDQFMDRTRGFRERTFFGNGIVGHAHFADPTCATLRNFLESHLRKVGATVHTGGTYVCIEGPQFSTRAESALYRSWDSERFPISVIGMTAVPEAQLAREAGICYQIVAMATDYDCWNEAKGDVSVEAILRTIRENVAVSRKLIASLAEAAIPPCRFSPGDLMTNAIVTPKEMWPESRREEMEILLAPPAE